MFRELLDNPNCIEPRYLQSDARKRWPSVVQTSHLQQRVPRDLIPSSNESKYVIIGVASYSPDELGLLDDVEASHANWDSEWKITVFDVMDCKDMEVIRQFAPQIPIVAQTPVVEIWVGGKLIDTKTGLRMTRESLQKFGILP